MATITLPPGLPARMKRLRRDEVGRPVPFFVEWIDGKADFRFMDSRALVAAVRDQLCFICGERLNRAHRGSNAPRGTFVAGPMCVVNGTSAEPPNHADCAEWSARACPFLTKPGKERRETNVPDEVIDAAGFMIRRNPGVTALIDSLRWRLYHADAGGEGVLFHFTDIESVVWMCEGRSATVDEIMASIDSGLPDLIRMCEGREPDLRELGRRMLRTMRWVGHPTDIAQYPAVQSLLELT